MENNVAGAVAGEEQYSMMLVKFIDILFDNKDFTMKIDEMWTRILILQKEQQKMLNQHTKIMDASNLLELLCKAFQSANKIMREGGISQVKSEWEKLSTPSENPYDVPISVLIERIKKISIETVENEDLSVSQQGDCSYQKKLLLAAEMDFGKRFSPSLAVLEDDLMKQNKLMHLEHTQQEEKVKRTLGTFARFKLDLSKYEDECHRLQNILQKYSNTLCLPLKTEVNKMCFDLTEIKKKNAAMLCQWQVNHNILCGILDDLRMYNIQFKKHSEKMWQLCRICEQLNSERMELIHHLMENTSQGPH